MTINERLKEERLRLGLSQEEFAVRAGVSKRAQANYEKGDRSPQADYLFALDLQGVDSHYVLTGRRISDSTLSIASASADGFSPVPMYDIEAAAGTGRLFDAEYIESTIYFPTDLLTAEGRDPANQVGAKVRGDSMLGTLNDGDRVLVDRGHRKPDGVFLLRMGNELRIKRIQRVAGGAWFLISDNERYEREIIKPEHMGEVEVIGECWIRIGRIA